MLLILLEVNISPAQSRRLQVENQEKMTKTSSRLVVRRLTTGELQALKTGRLRYCLLHSFSLSDHLTPPPDLLGVVAEGEGRPQVGGEGAGEELE